MSHLDTNPNVLEWQSEELFIPYIDPVTNRKRRYFPDFVATFIMPDNTIQTMMIEVKPKKQTMEPKVKTKKTKQYIYEVTTWATNQAKWKYANAYCQDKGWYFKILTEDDIFGKKANK